MMNSNNNFVFLFSDNEINPPMIGPDDMLIPLRNNAAGKMTGLEVLLRDINEYFPNNMQAKGYNVRQRGTVHCLLLFNAA